MSAVQLSTDRRPLVSICIAVYQNAGSLRPLVEEIKTEFEARVPEIDLELVFVNDGSTDGSAEILSDLAAENPTLITVIHFSRNFGQLFAMIAALDQAKGDAVISVSADQQDPISVATAMVRSWLGGSNIVIAHRAKREGELTARITSAIAYRFLRLSTPNLPPGGFDYFLLDKRAADVLRSQRNRNRFFPTDILGLGYKVSYIPYTRRSRQHGRSQYSFWTRLRSLINAVVDSSYLPIRMMSTIGAIFFVAGNIYAVSVAIARFMGAVPAGGYAVIVILILTIGGLIILMLGVLGEYVWRIYDELRSKPLYLIDRIQKRDEHSTTNA